MDARILVIALVLGVCGSVLSQVIVGGKECHDDLCVLDVECKAKCKEIVDAGKGCPGEAATEADKDKDKGFCESGCHDHLWTKNILTLLPEEKLLAVICNKRKLEKQAKECKVLCNRIVDEGKRCTDKQVVGKDEQGKDKLEATTDTLKAGYKGFCEEECRSQEDFKLPTETQLLDEMCMPAKTNTGDCPNQRRTGMCNFLAKLNDENFCYDDATTYFMWERCCWSCTNVW